jgi:hypothetical protein
VWPMQCMLQYNCWQCCRSCGMKFVAIAWAKSYSFMSCVQCTVAVTERPSGSYLVPCGWSLMLRSVFPAIEKLPAKAQSLARWRKMR